MKNIKITKVLICSIIAAMCLFLLSSCDYLDSVRNKLSCEHEYHIVSSNASCEKAGTSIYKCEKCGNEKTIFENAKSHDYEQIDFQDSTCAQKGYKVEKCNLCQKELTTDIEKKSHQFSLVEDVPSTCSIKGYKLEKCDACQEEQRIEYELKKHVFWDWYEVKVASSSEDGEERRVCKNCSFFESRVIKYLEEMDLTLIQYEYEDVAVHKVNSFEELSLLFNASVLNLKPKLVCDINFTVTDFNGLVKRLLDANDVPFDLSLHASSKISSLSHEVTFTIDYYGIPTMVTPKLKSYTQKPSLNYQPIEKVRTATFNDFKINNSAYSFQVETGEQLLYCLERRVKPICVEGSSAERLYREMKSVLRSIIRDDMTDVEKVRAIHDYIVMEVTYDQELYDLVGKNEENIKEYAGFYLEGVFEQKNAVCEGISKAICALCNIEGIPCVCVSGYQTKNPDGVGHAWNKVFLDGKWYVLDATSDGVIINGQYEVLSYAFFLISEKQMEEIYTANDYKDYACTSQYNIFADIKLQGTNNEISLDCQSVEDLSHVFQYIRDVANPNETLQVYLNFDYGDDMGDELESACKKAMYYGSYSTITSGPLVTIIK